MSATCVAWYVAPTNTPLCKHCDPVFPHCYWGGGMVSGGVTASAAPQMLGERADPSFAVQIAPVQICCCPQSESLGSEWSPTSWIQSPGWQRATKVGGYR